jgi:monofunctional biosynthetic peptidoglycan transglycosylase
MKPRFRIFAGMVALMVLGLSPNARAQEMNEMVVVDFQTGGGLEWFIVNDGVMGGRSQSDFQQTAEGQGRFSGYVSLENNGGFASVRAVTEGVDLTSFEGLEIRVLGDGRTYDFRLRTDGRFDGMAYRAPFTTNEGEWVTVRLLFSAFEPTFRGWVPRNAPPLDPGAVRQMGLLVGGKQEGPFRLDLAWIRAYSADPGS